MRAPHGVEIVPDQREELLEDAEDPGIAVGEKKFKAKLFDWFPWIPQGSFIYASPIAEGEEKLSSGVYQVTGLGTNKNQAIVVAVGPGDFVPGVGFVSPSAHHGIMPGDIVHYSDVGPEIFGIDGQKYLELEYHHIRAKMRGTIGLARRQAAIAEIKKKLAAHASMGDNAGVTAKPTSTPEIPKNPFMVKREEAAERRRRVRGERTKVQVVVDKPVS